MNIMYLYLYFEKSSWFLRLQKIVFVIFLKNSFFSTFVLFVVLLVNFEPSSLSNELLTKIPDAFKRLHIIFRFYN